MNKLIESFKKDFAKNSLLSLIAIGIFIIVIQNAIARQVEIANTPNINISNTPSVNVSNRVEATIGNTVDVNIHEINGYNAVTTQAGRHSVFPYGYMLPMSSW